MALKRLTSSDLTLFKTYYTNQPGKMSKQKALNLTRRVFVDELYPELKKYGVDAKLQVSLCIYGPGFADAHTLQRKIIKSETYKNWRLNGELVYSPEDNLSRYDMLKPDDIALMGFQGQNSPEVVCIDFISVNNKDDELLHDAFSKFIGSAYGNMKKITAAELNEIVAMVAPDESHPVFRFTLDEDIAEAVAGDPEAALRVYKRSGRVMTKEELLSAKQKADGTGSDGEELVAQYLGHQVDDGQIADFEWISRENAIAPYDFKIINLDGTNTFLDVKSTKSAFSATLHISMAELITMARVEEEYTLYRIYDLTEKGGKLRISQGMRTFARSVLEKLNVLPINVRVDSISHIPDEDTFGNEITVFFEDEDGA